MSTNIHSEPLNKPGVVRGVIQRGLQVFFILLLYGAFLFLSAGRFDWPAAWAYLGVYLLIVIVNMVILLPTNPEFISERGQEKEGTKGWDKVVSSIMGI